MIIIFIYLGMLMAVHGRHLDSLSEPELLSPEHDIRKHSEHRRKRWEMNFPSDYPLHALISSHSYLPERRDYDRNRQDLLPEIVRLLEEIATSVKRPQPPPPPPQPIYIPYPVPYAVPQYTSCSNSGKKKPNVTSRFPEMEDPNQNWGFVTTKDDETDDLDDGARPISFDPITPIRPMKRPPPKVDHGSTQGDSQLSTEAPKFSEEPPVLRTPSMCNAAVLTCCADNKQKQKACFKQFGCAMSYDDGNVCSPESISAALELFTSAYSPVH